MGACDVDSAATAFARGEAPIEDVIEAAACAPVVSPAVVAALAGFPGPAGSLTFRRGSALWIVVDGVRADEQVDVGEGLHLVQVGEPGSRVAGLAAAVTAPGTFYVTRLEDELALYPCDRSELWRDEVRDVAWQAEARGGEGLGAIGAGMLACAPGDFELAVAFAEIGARTVDRDLAAAAVDAAALADAERWRAHRTRHLRRAGAARLLTLGGFALGVAPLVAARSGEVSPWDMQVFYSSGAVIAASGTLLQRAELVRAGAPVPGGPGVAGALIGGGAFAGGYGPALIPASVTASLTQWIVNEVALARHTRRE
ncbi:MAG: hypothetical protein ACOZNI_34385 [Myxococcota bacterium]